MALQRSTLVSQPCCALLPYVPLHWGQVQGTVILHQRLLHDHSGADLIPVPIVFVYLDANIKHAEQPVERVANRASTSTV